MERYIRASHNFRERFTGEILRIGILGTIDGRYWPILSF